MSLRLASLLIISLFSVALLAAPALGISVSVSTGNGNGVATSSTIYSLDDSTSLNEQTLLKDSELQKTLQASGTGKNEISQQMTGGSSSLQSSAISQGSLDISSSGYASSGSASLGVGLSAQGDLSLSGQASLGQAASGQEAGVADGLISTSQSLSAGQGALSSQSTEMAGVAGYVASAAFSQQNEMVATGSFLGEGLLSADLGAVAAETATTSGQASMDGVTYLRDATMQEISSESLGMRMMGLRETGNGIGTFEMNVFNREAADNYAYDQAADTAGGSTSSYVLTGYRWNQNNPQIQLYLNPTGMPSGLTDASARDAIAAAANTWDNAVAQNLFIDTNTVIVDYNKAVNNPSATTMDGYNVNGWWDFSGTNTLGLSSWWYNPDSVVGGYKSILESDIWYAKDKSWSTSGTGSAIDFQTVATHELGHSIGLGDLYTLPNGDPRKNDFAQVMNSYDAPQRTLGNGDRTGATLLYGRNDGAVPVFRMYSSIVTDHFYTMSYDEYTKGAVKVGYQKEGLMGYIYPSNQPGMVPLYRMYSPIAKDHFYTTSYDEYTNGAVNVGYQKEGLMGYIYPDVGSSLVPLYRMYSPIATDHFYTTNYDEYTNGAVRVGYQKEGSMGAILNI